MKNSLARLLDADHAQAMAESLHRGQRDAGGALLIDHVRRVAAAVPREARVVAWLHELLEHTSIPEEALRTEGLSVTDRDEPDPLGCATELGGVRVPAASNGAPRRRTFIAANGGLGGAVPHLGPAPARA